LDRPPQGSDANRHLVVVFHGSNGMGMERGFSLGNTFLFGAGEAGVFPNLTKSFTTWLPKRERVVAQGIMWTSARWGGAFTPLLVVWVFHYISWRRAFEVFGAIGIIWAVFFYRWYRDNPRDHKRVGVAELALLEGSEHLAGGHGNVPWKRFLTSKTVWMLWAQYFLACYPWYFFITWLPTYLQQYYGLSPERGAQLAIFPLFFGGIGTLVCGFLASYTERRLGDVVRARRFIGYIGFYGAGILLILHTQVRDPLYACRAWPTTCRRPSVGACVWTLEADMPAHFRAA
jgi:ACS family glucarate transporter-like MFS transporter